MRHFLSLTLIITLLCLPGIAGAADAPSLVRIYDTGTAMMNTLMNDGIEIAKSGKNFVEVVVSQEELNLLRKRGQRFETLIPDLDRYVRDRMAMQTEDAKYSNYESVTTDLKSWAKSHKNICSLSSLGKSIEGREIWALKISDNPTKTENEPAVLLDGAHHAREWTTIEVPLAIIQTLLEGYGKDERLTRLVNEREIWIVPLVNPDGHTWSQTNYKYWRKNRRPLSEPDAPRKYFGVDLNRNYDYHWGESGVGSGHYSDTWPGAKGFSEPETRALRDLAERVNFLTQISYHSYSELILYPFGYATGAPNPDLAIFKALGEKMAKHNHYTVQSCTDLYPASGISCDWHYGEKGTISYVYEMGEQFIPPPTEIPTQIALNVPASLELVEYGPTAALARTGSDEKLLNELDLTDSLSVLQYQSELLAATKDETRDQLASAHTRQKARLAEKLYLQLQNGDLDSLTAVKGISAAQDVLTFVHQRLIFEAGRGNARAHSLLTELGDKLD